MAYVTKSVDIDINLEDFDDDEIYEEYHGRGLRDREDDVDEISEFDAKMEHIKWEWDRGSQKEALILLERLTGLKDLSNLVV